MSHITYWAADHWHATITFTIYLAWHVNVSWRTSQKLNGCKRRLRPSNQAILIPFMPLSTTFNILYLSFKYRVNGCISWEESRKSYQTLFLASESELKWWITQLIITEYFSSYWTRNGSQAVQFPDQGPLRLCSLVLDSHLSLYCLRTGLE